MTVHVSHKINYYEARHQVGELSVTRALGIVSRGQTAFFFYIRTGKGSGTVHRRYSFSHSPLVQGVLIRET